MAAAPISVIIPAYNAAPWLAHTLSTVQSQTVTPLEILVVDNGSTDNTVAIATEMGATVLHESEKGAAAARNAGLRAARGEWVALLDADDYWTPEKLELQWSLVQQFPDLGLVTANYFFDQEGKRGINAYDSPSAGFDRLPKTTLTPFAVRVTVEDVAAQLAAGNVWIGLNSSAVLFHKADALAIGGYDTSLARVEDMEFFGRLLPRFTSIALVTTPVLAYRWHGANSSHSHAQMAECHVRFREMILQTPSRYLTGAVPWATITLPRWYRQLAMAQLRSHQGRNARVSLHKSWNLKPNWRTVLLWASSYFRG